MNQNMEKLLPGVYRIRFGEPEKFTYTTFREYPMLPFGKDCPPPFTGEDIGFQATARGCSLSLPLNAQVFGFGLQLKAFNHTRKMRVMRNNADAITASGESHAPTPFYVTTRGYGVLVDSARDVAFYCGQSKKSGASRVNPFEFKESLSSSEAAYQRFLEKDRTEMLVDIPQAKGVDIYVFAGESMLEAVQKYNMFCGGGADLPEWALGVWYRMYIRSVAEDWVRMGQKFRDQKLPVSVLGLEPGWQTHAYACTFAFDEERLGDPKAALQSLKDMGYEMNLWEHCFTHPDAKEYDALLPVSGDREVWGGLVPDFALPEAREAFLKMQTPLGVQSFKLDECDGSDHTGGWSFPYCTKFPSGLDGEQMHHLLGLLYQQTMNGAFPGSCHSVRAAGALAAPYPFVLYSDLYDHKDFIRGVVNAGFSGLLWSPEVRHAKSVKDLVRRIQTVIFSPQALINAWYLKNPPWEQIDRDLNNRDVFMEDSEGVTQIVRELMETREKFVPYLKKMFEQYRTTGKPVFRAMILDYPDEEDCLTIDDQYLVGDDYLFAPLTEASDTREVYLPCDGWRRNGESFGKGLHTFTCPISEWLLFEKGGTARG